MNLVKQRAIIKDHNVNTKRLEEYIRVCYDSNDRRNEGSDIKLIRHILKHKHYSVLEHQVMTVEFVTDRAIANQIVRHRHGSFSQKSTRYCKEHDFIDYNLTDDMIKMYEDTERLYHKLIADGMKSEDARKVLPLGLATTIVVTGNIRFWLEFFDKRLFTDGAQAQIKDLLEILYVQFKEDIFKV